VTDLFHRDLDGPGHAVEGQISLDHAGGFAGPFHGGAGEDGLGVTARVQEIAAAQVKVAESVVGVDAAGVDLHQHRRVGGVVPVEDEASAEIAEPPVQPAVAEVLDAEGHRGMLALIVDDVGSWGLNKSFYSSLKKNGIEIYSFMSVRFPRLTSRVNFRNHRKIAIVDGKIGFTGGINIADRYVEGLPGLGPWRDTHLKIEGDAVATLQVVFAADWYFVTKNNLTSSIYFPPFSEAKGMSVQISASGPDYDWENISQAYFAAISNARKRVYIVTPYLMPPPELLTALKTVALSQVDVRIIIPEKSDAVIPKWSSFSYAEELLEAGIRLYFYQNGFIHSKIMIVDDVFSTIGTTNFDFRSFETNFEVNAFIYNKEFTTELANHFNQDLTHSREIKLAEWKLRPWHYKFRESLAHIIAPMM